MEPSRGFPFFPGTSWITGRWIQVLGVGFAAWLLYGTFLAIYRVTLHPLAKFPGPKLAGATYWYEVWFDVVCWGKFTHEIKRLHEIYGPIVRINPDEVHCNDPEFVDVIYAIGSKKRNKSKMFVEGFAADLKNGGFGTVDHAHHRLRRAAASKYFSRAQITKLEWVIHQDAQRLCDKFLWYQGRGPFEAASAYSCFTADIVSDYCFGQPFGFLQQPDWEPNFKEAVYAMLQMIHIMRHFPWTTWLMEAVPLRVIRKLSSKMGALAEQSKVKMPEMVRQTKSAYEAGIKRDRTTVIHSLLESDLPPEEKTIKRLTGEATVMLAAGTETTASALSVCTYHLLRNPDVVEKIKAELLSVTTDPKEIPTWATLEKLPYFSASIMEALRMGYGSPSRLPRIAPDEDLVYQGTWTAPGASSPVEVTHVIPRGYASADRPRLAYCELHVAIAAMTLRVLPQLRLYETTDADIEYDYDLAVAMPKKGSKGIRLEVA
ncbi:hypothetical protein CaCOL14_007136 [Colletotrichum acutatum]